MSCGLILDHLEYSGEAFGIYEKAVEVARNDPTTIDEVVDSYKAEIEKSEKNLSETSEDDARRRYHYKKEVEGIRKFLKMLSAEK